MWLSECTSYLSNSFLSQLCLMHYDCKKSSLPVEGNKSKLIMPLDALELRNDAEN